MKKYLVTPGPAISNADGSSAHEYDSITVKDADADYIARFVAAGRLIEQIAESKLSLTDLDDEALAAAVEDATAPSVIAAVGDDEDLAAKVVEAEKAGKARVTIIETLSKENPS